MSHEYAGRDRNVFELNAVFVRVTWSVRIAARIGCNVVREGTMRARQSGIPFSTLYLTATPVGLARRIPTTLCLLSWLVCPRWIAKKERSGRASRRPRDYPRCCFGSSADSRSSHDSGIVKSPLGLGSRVMPKQSIQGILDISGNLEVVETK